MPLELFSVYDIYVENTFNVDDGSDVPLLSQNRHVTLHK